MMKTRRHDPWIHRLSEVLDGELSPEEARAFEAHRATCPDCAAALEGIGVVVERARALEEVQPARDLWPEIARAIAEAGAPRREAEVIELPTAVARDVRPAGVFLTVRQLAAAAVALVLMSGAATWAIGPGVGAPAAPPAPAGDAVFAAAPLDGPLSPEMAESLRALEEVLASARDRLDPSTVAILERNLLVIEQAIEESRRALAADPENGFLQDHLDRAYERKLSYLQEVTRITEWSG